MTDLRKAAEMALERLESHEYWMDEEAIQALRQALLQPQEWKHCRHCGFQYRPPKEDKWHPLSQPEQEPVGFVIRMTGQYHTGDFCGEFQSEILLKQGQVLYTAPPKREWVGLTRRELDIATLGLEDLSDCYKAIEAKLKEKNT